MGRELSTGFSPEGFSLNPLVVAKLPNGMVATFYDPGFLTSFLKIAPAGTTFSFANGELLEPEKFDLMFNSAAFCLGAQNTKTNNQNGK